MRLLFALALFGLAIPQTQTAPRPRSGVEIVAFEFEFKMVDQDAFPPRMVLNQPPVLNPSPNGSRSNKIESPVFANHREKGRLTTAPIKVPVYYFGAQVKNDTSKPVIRLVWAYRPSLDSEAMPDKEFLCDVRMAPGETKAVNAISSIPRQRVVRAAEAGSLPPTVEPALKDMVVNQVYFSDGTTWQRSDWNPIVLTRQGAKKLSKGKCIAL